jgi:hypothetical protein
MNDSLACSGEDPVREDIRTAWSRANPPDVQDRSTESRVHALTVIARACALHLSEALEGVRTQLGKPMPNSVALLVCSTHTLVGPTPHPPGCPANPAVDDRLEADWRCPILSCRLTNLSITGDQQLKTWLVMPHLSLRSFAICSTACVKQP